MIVTHPRRQDPHKSAIKTKRGEGKHVDKPTTAVANKNTKDMFTALNEVDPARISEVLKNAATQFNKVHSLLAFAASSSGGGGQSPNSGLKSLLTDALTGALCILVKKYGYTRVLNFITTVFTPANVELLPTDYKELVKNALIKFYTTMSIYGERNVPTSRIPPIVFGTFTPIEVVVEVPDLYVQQYFTEQNDPFPGYIQWVGPDEEIVYTLRTPDEPPFETAEQHVYSLAEQGLAAALSVYFDDNKLVLTIAILLELLIYYCNLMEEKGLQATVGKNSKNSTNLLQLLGSVLGSLTSAAQMGHIPPSVLNKGKMNQVISNQNMMQGRLNSLIKPALKKAVSGSMDDPSGLLSGLLGGGNLAALTSQMSNLSRLTGGIDISIPSIPALPQASLQVSLNIINNSNDVTTIIDRLQDLENKV